jgi:hypothetical protein
MFLMGNREEEGGVKGSVQDIAAQKVSAVLQVQQDAERLMASVRHLLAVDHRYYELEQATALKSRRSA